MGLEKSIKLIESLASIDAIFITQNKEIYVTSGMKDKFKIINKEFTYKEEPRLYLDDTRMGEIRC